MSHPSEPSAENPIDYLDALGSTKSLIAYQPYQLHSRAVLNIWLYQKQEELVCGERTTIEKEELNGQAPRDMRPDDGPENGPKSSSSTSRERIFGVLALLFFLLFILLLAAGLYFYLTHTVATDICLTPGCIKTASVILSSMNSTVDPCTDFYEYACGQWIRGHPIPDDAPSVSNFENLGQDLEFALKELLEKKEPSLDSATSAVAKAKHFYRLCLNESEIVDNWRTTFDEVIKSFGGWPSLGSPMPPDVNIEKLYGLMVAKFKADFLFKATVQPDDKNSQRHVLLIDQPTLNLFARDFYVLAENEERLAYLTLIRDVLVLLNARPDVATRDAEEIIEFETALANITMADEQRHDIAELYTKVTLGEMRRKLPNFDWFSFFNHIFHDIKNTNGERITFDDSAEVVVYGFEFLRRLDHLLPNYDRRKIVNYMQWCWFFKTMLRDLPDPFALTVFKFYKSLNLMNVQKVRWHGCVTRINSLMPMATSAIYVKNHFDHEAKQQVEEMISLIMESFVDLLLSEDWLTAETKKFAIQKVNEMKRKIGYPDYLNDPAAVDSEYAHFKVYPDHYYKTKFDFYEQYQRDVLKRITQPVDRERWVAGAALVNAFYSPNTNEIIFPAGILQPVFYSKDFPSSMNFGGIGVVIGHEITHGFDDRGRLYDNLGNIRQWWDNATISKFEHKAECIEQQYSSYVLDQIKMQINGKSTKGENIADNGGLKQAYRAYKRYEAQHNTPPKLPGVNLTHDQLFFLNYAQIWCGTMNDKEAVRKLRTSEHSPGPIRVKGPLSNSLDFAKAFHCAPGSPMNPNHKCRGISHVSIAGSSPPEEADLRYGLNTRVGVVDGDASKKDAHSKFACARQAMMSLQHVVLALLVVVSAVVLPSVQALQRHQDATLLAEPGYRFEVLTSKRDAPGFGWNDCEFSPLSCLLRRKRDVSATLDHRK
ncbi:unnamed protein product [Caenorhabditis auriculariae]|uniref:Peptidase M13 C-terminal domain-containing protein n=1 Tax=Caenorhabditis auriculariae TaxID=2777116 RepID=A0A8S1HQQ7_9PELO|nr:unnamed protein product [Caenorhabditis auriculariae]